MPPRRRRCSASVVGDRRPQMSRGISSAVTLKRRHGSGEKPPSVYHSCQGPTCASPAACRTAEERARTGWDVVGVYPSQTACSLFCPFSLLYLPIHTRARSASLWLWFLPLSLSPAGLDVNCEGQQDGSSPEVSLDPEPRIPI